MWIALLGVALVMGLAAGAGPAGAKQTPMKVDCKNGGWQQLADSAGRPFKNQGACVNFVAKGGTPHPLALQLALSGSGIASVDGGNPLYHQISTFTLSGQADPGGPVAGLLHVEFSSPGGSIAPPPAPNSTVLELAGGTISGHLATYSGACLPEWCGQQGQPGFTVDTTITIAVDSATGQFAGFTTGTLTLHYSMVMDSWPPPSTETLADATLTGTLTP
jgi:hypothetical protein